MRALSSIGRTAFALVVAAALPALVQAQPAAPVSRLSLDEAVRMAVARNQALQAQRLSIDAARADEITAALKPNLGVSFGAEGFPTFSPRQFTWDFVKNVASYSASASYLFERGGKRDHRIAVAQATTEVTARNVLDAERQLRFETAQAFVSVLYAKSTLDLARENLKSFSDVVDVNRQRVASGDLAEADFFKISLQKLQFEQDVSAGEVALEQARASLRQLLGFEAVAEDFEPSGELAATAATLDVEDLKRQALDARPDLQAARANVTLAQHTLALEQSNKARDIAGDLSYSHTGPSNSMGVGASFDLPIHDRNQGNIARSEVLLRQATESELAARYLVTTDVVNAYAAWKSARKVVALYRVGLLEAVPAVAGDQPLRLPARRRQPAGSPRRRAYLPRYAARLPPGAVDLHDQRAATQLRRRNTGDSMKTALPTAAFGLALAVAACGSRTPESTPPAKAAAADPAQGAPSAATYFTVPPEQLAHIGVAQVKEAAFATELRTTGTVDWDNDHTTQAISQVSGPITRIMVDTGVRVKAGQPLLYVASPDISNAFASYRKARNRLDLAKRNLDRSRDLLEHKAIAQRDFEQAQADYNDAETDVEAALQGLRILGVPAGEVRDGGGQEPPVRQELPMRAPIAGIVVQKLVTPGQVIQAGATTGFVISDVSTVWVQGHVYEKDLRLVRVGDAVEVRSASFPDTFPGRVAYIGSMLDPATRTTPVRIVTANPGGLLKKDQFVDIVLHDRSTHEALVIPTSAVLYDTENLPFVYVQVEAGRFAQRSIQLGPQQGDLTEVRQGLAVTDRVVTQGSVFLQFANSYQG